MATTPKAITIRVQVASPKATVSITVPGGKQPSALAVEKILMEAWHAFAVKLKPKRP